MRRLLLILTLVSSYKAHGFCATSGYYSGGLKEIKDKLTKNSSSVVNAEEKVLLLNLLQHVNTHGSISKNQTNPELYFETEWELQNSGDKTFFKMNLKDFKYSIQEMTSKTIEWSKLKSSEPSKVFLASEELYLSAIGENNYLKAIFYSSIDKDSEAKKILLNEFEKEYNRAVSASYTQDSICGGTPQFFWLDKVFKSLENLANEDELSELKKKYKKAQLHISNVPRSHILT